MNKFIHKLDKAYQTAADIGTVILVVAVFIPTFIGAVQLCVVLFGGA